jgi:hypothetical protein
MLIPRRAADLKLPTASKCAMMLWALPIPGGNAMPPTDELLDRQALLDRVGPDRELLAALVEMYHVLAPKDLAAVHDAIRKGVPADVGTAAHALKNTVLNFTNGSAYTLAFRLEQMGKQGDLTDAPATYTELETAVANLDAALSRLLQE